MAFKASRIGYLAGALCLGAFTHTGRAEDFGAYSIVPLSAPKMTLEVVGAGTTDGTIVSIGNPAGSPNQKWVITPQTDGTFAIKPSYSSTLSLAVAKGETKMGGQLVLETDTGLPSQRWTLVKQDDGSYTLSPKHAPDMGIDDNGGKQTPGAKIDIWKAQKNDQHLHWQIKPLAGTGITTAAAPAEAKAYEPPVTDPSKILPGTTKEFVFDQSKIFPGTTRQVTVFIPAQYDGSKPACVYIKTDGYNPKEKAILEEMMAAKEIPVTVGVFVRPGEVPAPVKGTIGRRNRDLEYDGVGDENARFFAEELLPYVAKEYNLNLSTDGNDHCISGGSSGGIAAFVAAWHRPDWFSRVYAASGSFVAFRGGHEFPTMIRKYEAKPIRSFMTTATHDMENCAGDWFVLDQEMDKALKFSGYDYIFRIIEGRHVAGYMDNYREAMAYLWKGWPEHVKAGESAPRARDVLLPDEGWHAVAKGYEDISGAAVNAAGAVFFADTEANKIQKIGTDGKVSTFVADADHANGVTVGADGIVYAVSQKSGKITSYDASGKGSVVMEGVHGHSILALPAGGFYVTTNDCGCDTPGEIWFVKDGKKTLADAGLKLATGLAYRPDQWLLAVSDGASRWAYSYQFAADGKLTNKERYFWFHVQDWEDDAAPGEIYYSLEGKMFVATRAGVQITADDGPTQVILPLPDHSAATAVCEGGADQDTLYVFGGGKIWSRKVKTHAMGAFSPWTKVGGTPL